MVYDRNQQRVKRQENISLKPLKEVCQTDILFLIVPISQMEICCKQIKKFLSPATIVADVCSVKVHPGKVMMKTLPKNQPIIATHPLFGPDSAKKNLSGHKIVVCPLRAAKTQNSTLANVLKKMGLEIFITTPENHDRQMANSQGLVHFIGRGIKPLKLKSQDLYTPDYLSLLHINEMVVHDTKQLFLDMHRYNPFAKNVRNIFLNRLLELEKEINEK